MLNGVEAARGKRVKPPPNTILRSLNLPACAPRPTPLPAPASWRAGLGRQQLAPRAFAPTRLRVPGRSEFAGVSLSPVCIALKSRRRLPNTTSAPVGLVRLGLIRLLHDLTPLSLNPDRAAPRTLFFGHSIEGLLFSGRDHLHPV
jgi:hypothetical protein